MKKGEEEEIELQKSENLEIEKSFLCEIKSVFHIFKGILLVKYEKKGHNLLRLYVKIKIVYLFCKWCMAI